MTFQIKINENVIPQLFEAYRIENTYDLLDHSGATANVAEIENPDAIINAMIPIFVDDQNHINEYQIDSIDVNDIQDFLMTGLIEIVIAFKKGDALGMAPAIQQQLRNFMDQVVVDGVSLTDMSVEDIIALKDPEGAGVEIEPSSEKGFFKKFWKAIKIAIKPLLRFVAGFLVEISKFFIDVEKVDVESAILRLSEYPKFDFQPGHVTWSFDGMAVKVRLKFALRIMGWKLEVATITLDVDFEGKGMLDFQIQGAALSMRAHADNVTANILPVFYGLSIATRISLRTITNNAFDRLGWVQIFDVDGFLLSLPGSIADIKLALSDMELRQDEIAITLYPQLELRP